MALMGYNRSNESDKENKPEFLEIFLYGYFILSYTCKMFIVLSIDTFKPLNSYTHLE